MADEPINELIPIPDGGDAEAKPLRQNFTYLDNQIKSLKSNLDNKVTTSSIDAANGICPLNSNRKIPDGNVDYTNIDKKITTLGNTCVKTSGNQTINGTKDFKGTTKVPASTTDGTALQNTKIVKGGNGYCKLGNGLIIQWGASSTHQSDGRYTVVSYPIAFSSDSSYRVISNALSNYMSNDHSSWIYSKTRSGCVIANAVTGLTHLWVAIGS